MPILYNARFHTRRQDVYDGLLRLGGLIMFATSILVMTFSLYFWGV